MLLFIFMNMFNSRVYLTRPDVSALGRKVAMLVEYVVMPDKERMLVHAS